MRKTYRKIASLFIGLMAMLTISFAQGQALTIRGTSSCGEWVKEVQKMEMEERTNPVSFGYWDIYPDWLSQIGKMSSEGLTQIPSIFGLTITARKIR